MFIQIEIPSIVKLRERLRKLVSDRDAAEMNYQKASRVLSQPVTNSQVGTTKIESLREELDQAIIKMEQCRVGNVLLLLFLTIMKVKTAVLAFVIMVMGLQAHCTVTVELNLRIIYLSSLSFSKFTQLYTCFAKLSISLKGYVSPVYFNY